MANSFFSFLPTFRFLSSPPPQIWAKSPTQFPAIWIGGFSTINRIRIFFEDTVRTLPDTGSTLDAIPPSVYHRQFQDVPLDAGIHVETATGNHIKSLGSFQAQVDWKADDGSPRPVQSTVHVLENPRQAVLSKTTQQKLGMIPVDYPNVRVHQVSTARPLDEQTHRDMSKQTVPTLAYYDPTRLTALHTDASRLRGLGFILKQQQTNGDWKIYGPSWVTSHRPSQIPICNDRARMPRSGLGHEKM